MVAAFTRQEEEMLHRAIEPERDMGHGLPSVLNEDEKHLFLFFCVFFIKAFLSNNMCRMLPKVPKQTF